MHVIIHGSSGYRGALGLVDDHPAALLRLVEEAGPGPVLVLAPEHLVPTAREQAAVLLASDRGRQVGVLTAAHHSLTLTLIGAAVLDLEGDRRGWSDPGGAAQMVVQMAARGRSLVWHSRLLGLADPRPGWGQTLAAMLPSRGYLATVGVPGLLGDRLGVHEREGERWFVSAEAPARLDALVHAGLARIGSAAAGRAPYRTKASVELACLVSPDPPLVGGPSCITCGASLLGAACAFCGHGPVRVPLKSVRGPSQRATGNQVDVDDDHEIVEASVLG